MAINVHHVALCVSDWEKSHAFYARLFGLLGANEATGGTGAPHRHAEGRWCAFAGGVMVTLWEALPEHRDRPFALYAPGLHHLALAAADKEAVDAMYDCALELGATILDPPHMSGTSYVTFFLDPDGMKLEYRCKVAG